jgi:asparagine synthetase B (glutamine-hydrolysing)
MFLLSITERPLLCVLNRCRTEEIKLATGWFLTVVTDNIVSTVKIRLPEVRVTETPFLGTPDCETRLSSEITVNANDGSIQLFKSTIAGTTVYYYISRSGEAFCATHISMLRRVGVPIEENKEALPEFFIYRVVMAPQTMFKDIRQLPGGSRVFLKRRDRAYEIADTDDYDPPVPPTSRAGHTVRAAASDTLSILRETMRPVSSIANNIAFPLSGGLDSSILFKICQHDFNIDSTFSTGWPLPNGHIDTEKEYACSAAKAFKTRHCHHEVTIEDYLYGFLEAVEAAEQPIHHLQSGLLQLLFRDGIPCAKTVVVSGDGADSIFGSEFNYGLYRSTRGIRKIMMSAPLLSLLEMPGTVIPKLQRIIANGKRWKRKDIPLSDPNSVFWAIGAYGSADWVCANFGKNRNDIISTRYAWLKRFEDRSLFDIASLIAVFTSVSWTKAIWSKLGEYHNKILYYPYSGSEIMNYIYAVPWEVKLQQPKKVLREVANELKIPAFIVNRRKSAFGVQPEHWATPGGWFEPLIPLAAKVFPEKEIRGLQSANLESAHTFWNILNYSVWKRLVIDQEPLGVLLGELKENISHASSSSYES